MDRVEKALEKARLRREGGVEARASVPASFDGPTTPTTIVYDRTRQENILLEHFEKARLIAGLKNDWRANAFKILRTQILHRLSSEGLTTVGITSAMSGDGKSLVAANLAISMAMDINQTVLLVDLDLRRARLAHYFGLWPYHGLSDYLMDICELEDCLVTPGIERLVLLLERGSIMNSSEILGSPKMKELAQELKDRYADRIIIYDLPPVLTSDDALVIVPNLDAIILVVQEGKSTKNEVESALALLKDSKLIGTVLNKSTRKKKDLYSEGLSTRQAAARFEVGVSTAGEWFPRYRDNGETAARKQGQPPGSKLDAHETFILGLVEDDPDISLEEIAGRLSAERSVSAAPSTVGTFLKKRGIT